MTTSAPDERAFRALTDPYRRGLQLHCYRILGSAQDAEDALQETLVAAWRGLDGFERRASPRSWLYRIATNRCLNALRARSRRPARSDAPGEPLVPAWLEPYPDVLLEQLPDRAPGPEARYEAKEAMQLAFVAALQHIPPRQRAALVLRDVLGFRAAEAADMLEASEDAVESALKRARETLERRLEPRGRDDAPMPSSRRERELAGRFADAFERGDIDGIVALLADDAWVAMPPEQLEIHGRAEITAFLHERFSRRGDREFRLVPTRANTQPAFGVYLRDRHTPIAHAHGVIVLTLAGDRIAAMVRFAETGSLPRFGLPRMLRD